MEISDEAHVLYVEPEGPPADAPVWDDLCERVALIMAEAIPADYRLRGTHTCTGKGCRARSGNTDYVFRSRAVLNSLALHYLVLHRHEIPEEELAKVAAL